MSEKTPIIEKKNKKSPKDIIIENQQKQIDELSNLVKSLLGNKMSKEDTVEYVEIGCRATYPLSLSSTDGRISYSFSHGEIKEVELKDLKDLFKSNSINYVGLFKRGILYFVEPIYYEKFKISNYNYFDVAYFQKWLLGSNLEETIKEFNRATQNKNDFIALHNLIFSIGYVLIENSQEFQLWKYSDRVKIEEYFDVKFEQIIAQIKSLEQIIK